MAFHCFGGMFNVTRILSKTKPVVFGILQISAIFYLVLLTVSLISLTFFYDKDAYHHFVNDDIALMVISGERVIGKTGSDGKIEVLLKDVRGFIEGDKLTYAAGDGEFLIIHEGTGTFEVKKVIDATPRELERLDRIIPFN